jgi:hypothetical protein
VTATTRGAVYGVVGLLVVKYVLVGRERWNAWFHPAG